MKVEFSSLPVEAKFLLRLFLCVNSCVKECVYIVDSVFLINYRGVFGMCEIYVENFRVYSRLLSCALFQHEKPPWCNGIWSTNLIVLYPEKNTRAAVKVLLDEFQKFIDIHNSGMSDDRKIPTQYRNSDKINKFFSQTLLKLHLSHDVL